MIAVYPGLDVGITFSVPNAVRVNCPAVDYLGHVHIVVESDQVIVRLVINSNIIWELLK